MGRSPRRASAFRLVVAGTLVAAGALVAASEPLRSPFGPALAQDPAEEPAEDEKDPLEAEWVRFREALALPATSSEPVLTTGTALAKALDAAGRSLEAAQVWADVRAALGTSEATRPAVRTVALAEAESLLAFADASLTAGDPGNSVRAAYWDARTAFQRARDLGVVDPALSLGLARCADAEGLKDEQIAVLEAARAAFPADGRPRRALAFALLSANRFAEALPHFRDLSDAAPTDDRLALCLAQCARETGDEALALAAARRRISADPKDARGWQALWAVYSREKRWGELGRALEETAKDHPELPIAAHYSGFAWASAQDPERALPALRRAWALDPRNTAARTEAARLLLTVKKDRNGAAEILRDAVRAAPNDGAALALLGFVVQQRSDEGDHRGAARELAVLAEVRPDDAVTHANLGLELRWDGQYEAADAAYRRSLSLRPDDQQTWNDYGLMLLAKGDVAAAEKAFLAGHEADPSANDCMENLGFLRCAAGDSALALSWFRKAYAEARAKGTVAVVRHRRNLDDLTWPLPPLPALPATRSPGDGGVPGTGR